MRGGKLQGVVRTAFTDHWPDRYSL